MNRKFFCSKSTWGWNLDKLQKKTART